jgi:hypothetical protein
MPGSRSLRCRASSNCRWNGRVAPVNWSGSTRISRECLPRPSASQASLKRSGRPSGRRAHDEVLGRPNSRNLRKITRNPCKTGRNPRKITRDSWKTGRYPRKIGRYPRKTPKNPQKTAPKSAEGRLESPFYAYPRSAVVFRSFCRWHVADRGLEETFCHS